MILRAGETSILTDPWLSGLIFNDGWELLVPSVHTPTDLAEVSHIWISHEHPDHFHLPTLRAIFLASDTPPKIIIQITKDQRMADWCRKTGFEVLELVSSEWTVLSKDASILIQPFGAYDSYSAFRMGETTILNLNDCPLSHAPDLSKIRSLIGQPDVLTTQFSVAGWIGNSDNPGQRQIESQRQIKRLVNQIGLLKPKWVIPGFSFVRFCHSENNYLNENRVGIDEATTATANAGSFPVVLQPGSTWKVGTTHSSEKSINYYMDDAHHQNRKAVASDSLDMGQIQELAKNRSAHYLEVNNKFLMWVLEKFMPSLLSSIVINLWDLGCTVRFTPSTGLATVDAPADSADVSMHSSSLAYVLRWDWGLDTLTVNGRFHVKTGELSKLTAAFGLGALNKTGTYLSIKELPILIQKLVQRRFSSRARQARRQAKLLAEQNT